MADNVIELNGKQYDAVTGALLGDGPVVISKKATKTAHNGRIIDGFTRPTAGTRTVRAMAVKTTPSKAAMSAAKPTTAKALRADITPTPKAPRPVKPVASQAAQAASSKQTKTVKAPSPVKAAAKRVAVHSAATAAKAHQPERASTLMRHVVKKPLFTLKPAIKPQAPAEIAAKPLSAIAPKRSALQVDPDRLVRAQSTPKHSGVRRFLPLRHTATPSVPAYVMPQHTDQQNTGHVPIIAVRLAPPHERPAHRSGGDVFEAAIARAESHRQPKHPEPHHRVRRRRLANITAGVAAFLIIGGFIAWLNMPNLQLRVASLQAGFKATIPAERPTGYALNGGVQRSGNTITMSFQAGENHFSLTQQPSDWNSQTLQENTLALSTGNHKTVAVGGRTVYIYGSNAAWVSGGVRYDLIGNAPLSTQDITGIASSL